MKRISTIGAALCVTILSACAGSGSGASAPAVLRPLMTSSSGSSPQSFSESGAAVIGGAAAGAAGAPLTLAAGSSGASATAAFPASGSVPAGTRLAARFGANDGRAARDDDDGIDAIAYLEMEFSVEVTLPEAPAFSLTVPGTFPAAGATYWLAFRDPLDAAAGWQRGFEGPATVTWATAAGKPVTRFAFASNGRPVEFAPNERYYFALFGQDAGSPPQPTAAPTTRPSEPPSPHPSRSPEPHPSRSAEPVTSPTPRPSHSPSPCPSRSPEPRPSRSPEPTNSPEPTPTPTPAPTISPTQSPR